MLCLLGREYGRTIHGQLQIRAVLSIKYFPLVIRLLFGKVVLPTLILMSLSLVSNAYLDEQSAKIQSKPVPWEVSTHHLLTVVREIDLQN